MRAMTPWRLELTRLARSRTWIALFGAYLFFGLTGPLLARYTGELLARFGGDMVVQLPDPTPPDGIAQFSANAAQLGVLAVIIVAALALAFDARAETGAFFRTRASSLTAIVTPRYTVATLAACAALLLGTLAAWYGTAVLLGGLDVPRLLMGTALGFVYLAFVVAAVAFASSLTRSVLGAVGMTVAVLILLPVLSVAAALRPWLPSELIGAQHQLLVGRDPSEYLRSLASGLLITALLLAATIARLRRREL